MQCPYCKKQQFSPPQPVARNAPEGIDVPMTVQCQNPKCRATFSERSLNDPDRWAILARRAD